MGSILVVDDERSMREFLSICLRRAGHDVSVAESGEHALEALRGTPPQIVVTDLKLKGELDGLGVLGRVKKLSPATEVVVVTAFATTETAIQAMKDGAYDYLTKPFKVDEINAVIDRALEKIGLLEANAALRAQVEGRYKLASLLGKSPSMQRLFELVGKIHSTRTSVLITGESGTGKELVARALHTEGNRATFPFVAVNCGAIPEELMESELFGHVKGSFTGAIADKEGLFAQADQGSLFLDEIGELSSNLQVKLLRVLQERIVKPVGGTKERSLDVRVIAATNRDLEAEVTRGSFRQDLYYRLNVIELLIPPLRQRKEDLPILVEHFVRRYAADQQKRIQGLTPDAMRHLARYDYPGNVRELENIIERAVALAGSEQLSVQDLPEPKSANWTGVKNVAAMQFPDDGVDLDRLLYDYERYIVQQALNQASGVRKRAAQLLGVSFRSLRYRLAKLGLDSQVEANERLGG